MEAIHAELLGPSPAAGFRQALETAMLTDPSWWDRHYHGTQEQQKLARAFRFSDRARYYLPQAAVVAAATGLIQSLERAVIPESLVSQYLPLQYARVRSGELEFRPEALLVDHIRDVLRAYSAAARPRPGLVCSTRPEGPGSRRCVYGATAGPSRTLANSSHVGDLEVAQARGPRRGRRMVVFRESLNAALAPGAHWSAAGAWSGHSIGDRWCCWQWMGGVVGRVNAPAAHRSRGRAIRRGRCVRRC